MGEWEGTRGSRKGGLFGWKTVMWYGDLVTVGVTGLVRSEGGVRWKESHRQEWAGLDWKSRSGWGGSQARITRATQRVVVAATSW